MRVANHLRRLRLRGEVVQIQKGKQKLSRWGLPGAAIPDGWHVVANPREDLYAELLGALRERGGTARTARDRSIGFTLLSARADPSRGQDTETRLTWQGRPRLSREICGRQEPIQMRS